jgi:hypothetical protein
MNIRFYIERLRRSSLRELAHRARESVFIYKTKFEIKNGGGIEEKIGFEGAEAESLKLPEMRVSVTERDVREILGGFTYTLNGDDKRIQDYEKKWRHTFFSDVKPENEFIDIRSVWEPARLQHITEVIGFCIENPAGEPTIGAREFCRDSIIQWLKNNPFLFGPHYISVMECGLRIPVFFFALKTCVDRSSKDHGLLLKSIALHGWLISKRLSLYSSLGNHTIAEAVGLIFAGAIYRDTHHGRLWLETGCHLLEQESRHQIVDDGGPAEQSLSYHRFVLDLYWMAIDFLEKNMLHDCTDMKARVALGEEFLRTFSADGESFPAIGDSDSGRALAPRLSPKRDAKQAVGEGLTRFPASGYAVIKTRGGVTLTFDHGPLGMPPLYNHGHADALSITLAKNGLEFLIDPGTFRYNGPHFYRRYFKGTRAHNTATIDGKDQAVQESSFIWSKPFNIDLVIYEENDDSILVSAQHNGYADSASPVWHRRSIYYLEGCFIIIDTFPGKGIHEVELNYHLHPEVVATNNHGWWQLARGESEIFIALPGNEDFTVTKGADNPALGYYSPSYGIVSETNVLHFSRRADANSCSIKTVILTN